MTNTPPLYDTVRPIIEAWAERNLDLSHEEDVTIYLCLLNALLDGDDGLGYAIYIHGRYATVPNPDHVPVDHHYDIAP